MKKIALILTLIVSVLLPLKALSGIIEINYEIDFTSVSDNKDYDWVDGTPDGYDDQALIDTYLNGSYFINIRYDSSRDGYLQWDNGYSRESGSWAEIIDTNINLSISKGDVTHNSFGVVLRNKGQDKNAFTNVSNTLSWVMTSETIDEVTVGETSLYGSLENFIGEYDYYYGNSGSFTGTDAFTKYNLTATVTSVTKVPEPTTMVIFALGLLGFLSVRFRT